MASNWKAITESKFPWEREALNFVREHFPTHEPYRAWSNFEFIADDGSVNEVDLLVFTPQGFFLIEIKSRPGTLRGDASTWTWEHDGHSLTGDNPLYATNLKAKKLKTLLDRQRVSTKGVKIPFIEALVFCSAPDQVCNLQGTARSRVCLLDREAQGDEAARPGIMAAIKRRECPGLDLRPKGTHNKPTAKAVSKALEKAGVRSLQRDRKVGDYLLDQRIGEGPGYQDWLASHVSLSNTLRRVRLYLVKVEARQEDRETIDRAAKREFQLLDRLKHSGILQAQGFTEHQLGPALIFEHDPNAIRLDHFLVQRKDNLSMDVRLGLVRQIAEVMRFAHEKKVVHRALAPQSILVTEPNSDHPRVKIFNWQVAFRESGSTSTGMTVFTITSHADRLVDDASKAYLAPEGLTESDGAGEHLDVFSLGAIAYHLFSGEAPAEDSLALNEKLRATKGLQISAVLNGAGEDLQDLIRYSTHPEVNLRMDSVVEFLEHLDLVEDKLTAPNDDVVEDPARANKGDVLPGGLVVEKRLGTGACSVALLVKRAKEFYVLKVATTAEHNKRVEQETEVLEKLRHHHVVEFVEAVQVGERSGFLMVPVFAEKEKEKFRIETLGHRLRSEGRLHLDLLQRFGEDLLNVVVFLEEQGIPHRDIKPDNIAVGQVGRGSKLHLVLFDFSLARMPVDNVRAGTSGYLEPLLPLRKPPRWDLHAERYAAAMTLHELATATLPQWGDGISDPSHLDCEITIEPELFDAGLREGLTEFFRRTFRRNPGERHDNAEEMLREWRLCFEGIEAPGALDDAEDLDALTERLDSATFETQIPELGLGARATNALDRANVLTVGDFLRKNIRELQRQRGVGNKTRREIATALRILRKRLGVPSDDGTAPTTQTTEAEVGQVDVATFSVDLLAKRVTHLGAKEKENTRRTLQALLGLSGEVDDMWPGQTAVAKVVGVTRARVQQLVDRFQKRWAKEPSITNLRAHVAKTMEGCGGVMTSEELAEAILVSRGSVEEEPRRTRLANALVRAVVEVERSLEKPRFMMRRSDGRVLIALNQALADYAIRLGRKADSLAAEDPLAAPSRVVERLRGVKPPSQTPEISDTRLVRLAASASKQASVSSRQELYPRDMDAARALKLSQGALFGVQELTEKDIRARVRGRYPEAGELPGRPALDTVLSEAGLGFKWDGTAKEGAGCFINTFKDTITLSSSTAAISRLATMMGPAPGQAITPEIADARQFEERLQRSIKEGAFQALLVNPKHFHDAIEELCGRFPVQLVDFEGLFIDALREAADGARVKWDLVVKTDAMPGEGGWNNLLQLVKRAMPKVEEQLLAADKTILLIYPGLLARYGQMDLIDRLRDKVGRRDGIPGLWMLLAGDSQALIEGEAVPLLGPGQRTKIPAGWLKNVHRAGVTEGVPT